METLYAWIMTMALGFDTLIVSASLGLKKEPKDKVKIALAFASAESVMPVVGLIVGGAIGLYFDRAASAIGALLMMGVAVYFLFFDDEENEKKAFDRELAGWPLMAAAVGISLDELAVGLTAGMIQVPILLTILLIASRSFVFTFVGAAFGAKLKPYLGEWAEKTSGVMLGFMGVWMLLETLYEW